jgi:GH15 family glucan-1,4-alpha-glucosidase
MNSNILPPFQPLPYLDGYLPLADHGLLGDGQTAALVARDGALVWLCLPRFDAPPVFCHLLDQAHGGAFVVSPMELQEARQYYKPESAVLVTELRSRTGMVRVTDALTLRAGADLSEDVAAARGELIRQVEVLAGSVQLRVEIAPRGGLEVKAQSGGFALYCPARPELDLHLWSSRELPGPQCRLALEAGAQLALVLRWTGSSARHQPYDPASLLQNTQTAWQRWTAHISYDGPQAPLVRRAAITLKLLDYFANGALVAAPTSSLPERIGGARNWDYRYTWIRDATFTGYALHRIGCHEVAAGFLSWVLDVIERAGQPRVLYTLDGEQPPAERQDAELEGYRRSHPVRWGNAAAEQAQHDVYGELLDCAWLWSKQYGAVDASLWQELRRLVQSACRVWRSPDHGIWEVRTTSRPFTYSAALCQVALDRGAGLAERFALPGDVAGWRAQADEICQAILTEAWDEGQQSLTEHLGGVNLDASLLSLPLRHVLPATHPRMIATTAAIRTRLSAGPGLLYRYLPHESPDGLPGHEGAFLLCSFWLVDNLAYQGRLDEAAELFDSLCARANPLGLLPEEIDPTSGDFLGNFPQAFSHVGLISSGVNLQRLRLQAQAT